MRHLEVPPGPDGPVTGKAIIRLRLDVEDWRRDGNPLEDALYRRVHGIEFESNRVLFPLHRDSGASPTALYLHDSRDETSGSTIVLPGVSSVQLEEDHAWTTAGPDNLRHTPGHLVQSLAGIEGLGDEFNVNNFFARPLFHLEAGYASRLRGFNLE